MQEVRADGPFSAHPPQGQGRGPRLNLLLTDGGWRDESWAARLPRLLEPMGVLTRCVRSGREATDAIRGMTVHAAVVDLTLPFERAADHPACPTGTEEGGARLLDLFARVDSPPPIIVVREARHARDDARDLASALRHGVFAVVDRPVNMELMLEVLRRLLMRHYRGQWPGMG